MKTRPRDYITIGMALLAIFLCGYGIGFLLGEKDGKKNAPSLALPGMDSTGPESWENRTFRQLDTALDLRPDQEAKIRARIKNSATNVRRSQHDALKVHARHLIRLQSELLPLLDPEQQEKLRAQQDKLRESINLGLSNHSPTQ